MSHSSAIDLLRQQRLLLQMEYYCEKEAFRKLTELTGLLRKVKRGDAWFPLKIGRSYYNSLNQLSVEVFRTADQEIEHNFEYGRPVMFFRQKEPPAPTAATLPRLKYFDFTATVSYVDGDRMVLTVPDNAPLLELADSAQPVGCQLSFDETSYRAMFDALDRVASATTGRLAYLRELFYNRPPKAVAQQFATACPQLPWLNATQQEAVSSVLRAKDVAIVHGPPGTGKTTTLVEAINETLMREPQVMVCAQSNTAVDWISEKLTDRGIAVLRIGNPTRVDDKMLAFTYERRFEAHPDYSTLWAIRKAMRELRSQRRHSGESFHQKMSRLRSRATELEIRIQSDLFGQARVIASTLVGADSRLLAGLKVHTLFIDEAAQALEAASWIPIRRASRVVLAGDHCQLPPTVKSIAALKAGLGTTLMERIAQNHPEVVTLLRVQYRMNDQIMRFSSNYFYGGKVESAPQVRHRGILQYDYPISWIDSSVGCNDDGTATPGETFVASTFGRINTEEAELTLKTLEDYFAKVGRERILGEQIDVGIISPYRAQVQYLRQLIRRRAAFKPYRRLISVNTVDGFQGQERDIILISLVRSNSEGQIGFLNDLRRMNVAITRARMKLIILGDRSTLTQHPFYRKLWEYIEKLHDEE